ncbi:hypothetical protein PV328_007572 [Microctonus aethiopoides]|uniref:Nose resistant-to-fluoxetine protein N-terminal domain-containing protein n=1 Tax=Microctonus aethiopoides TaxID=144406 RepID=A0AA39C919_9HYME|nr:hypothetical protein PV328_007572 [Microctonus aethiopoides]
MRQINSLYVGITNMEQWALGMLDASSKIPSGLLKGNMKDIGMYDECVSIKTMKENTTIVGRHCMYTLDIKTIAQLNIPLQPMLSICLPAACNSNEVKYLLQSGINITTRYINISDITVTSVSCSNVDAEPWNTGTIITIIIFGSLIFFLMICTVCDFLMNINAFGMKNNSLLNDLCKFSFYNNGKRILSTSVSHGSLPAISGLRFFSMCWVIFGHAYVQRMMGSLINFADLLPWLSSWSALGVLVAPFAVDTFFVMSGFLTAYLFMKEMTKRRKFNPIIYYLHRYIRLTPALGALLLLTIFILPRIGSGALWEANMNAQKEICAKHWWNLLLYIQNYRNIEVMGCLGHTWYLAVDMQLFWISPLILYPLSRKPKIGIFIFAIFFIASIITPTVIALENKYSGGLMSFRNLAHITDMMSNYYVPSYTRATPWLVGIFMGYILSSTTNLSSIHFIRFGWIITVVAFAFTIFTYRIFQNTNYEFDEYWEGFYAAFSRLIWGFGVCWIIYASALGYGGIIGKFLSLPIFLPFSRISYSMYLVHFSIQNMKMSSARTPEYFSNLQMIYIFFSDFILCVFAGFIFSLLFESSFLVLEKMLLGKIKNNKSSKSREELQIHGISAL